MNFEWNPPKLVDRTATYKWGGGDVDYADSVHNGEVDLQGNKTPERAWTTVTIESTDLPELFESKLNRGSDPAKAIDAAFDAMAIELGEKFSETIDSYQWDIESRGQKQHKNAPTWKTISDSEALKNSQDLQLE